MIRRDSIRTVSLIETNGASALEISVICAMIAGLLQNILATYSKSGLVDMLDDAIIIIVLYLAVLRVKVFPAAIVFLIFLWVSFLGIALIRVSTQGTISLPQALFLFRQVAMPAIVIFCGIGIREIEWRRISLATIWIAILNCIYIGVEKKFGFIIDPAIRARQEGLYIYPEGVPGYYLGFGFGGESILRSGGLYLNPPTTGVLIAVAAVIVFHWRGILNRRMRWPLFIIMALAISATGSRAGILILVGGVILPILARYIGGYIALPILGLLALPVGLELLGHGGTGSHLDGLVVGFTQGLESVWGQGFGYAGNFSKELLTYQAGESLLGIAFSAAGLPVIAIALILLFVLVTGILKSPSDWTQSLALCAVLVAMFAETAGSMNATIPLWLAVGIAVNQSWRLSHDRLTV